MKRTGFRDRRRDRSNRDMSWLWFSCLALLVLLPPVSFAQTHLWQYRPFRANDTDHSGGDHICDLRRDSNADGKPDRLGDRVTVSGTVIAEPSTFETTGHIFWIREGRCGILVYGEPQNLQLGDSVSVSGWVVIPDGYSFFPEGGLASYDDITLENGGVIPRNNPGNHDPTCVSPREYGAHPAVWGGNLIGLTHPVRVTRITAAGADRFAWAAWGEVSITVYIDGDTGCDLARDRCYYLTGVVVRIKLPPAGPSVWCLVPRGPVDVTEAGCSIDLRPIGLGHLKRRYNSDRNQR